MSTPTVAVVPFHLRCYFIRVIKQSVIVRQRAVHARGGVRCAVLSQVALATPKVAAGKRLGAHLFIHVSPERGSDATPG